MYRNSTSIGRYRWMYTNLALMAKLQFHILLEDMTKRKRSIEDAEQHWTSLFGRISPEASLSAPTASHRPSKNSFHFRSSPRRKKSTGSTNAYRPTKIYCCGAGGPRQPNRPAATTVVRDDVRSRPRPPKSHRPWGPGPRLRGRSRLVGFLAQRFPSCADGPLRQSSGSRFDPSGARFRACFGGGTQAGAAR